jgi:uncharacterized protein YggE
MNTAAPLLSIMLLAAPVAAQPAPAPRPTILSLSAEGRVAAQPDLAELSAGVVSSAATAAAAMADNSRAMTAMVAALRKAGVAAADIQTSNLSLNPQYRYESNKPPVLTGYQASNTVNLKVRNLAGTGALIDAMVAAGANQINGPSFSLASPEAALDEARAAAVATARARAEIYAKAAGLKVKRIDSITEGHAMPPQPRPMMRMAMADSVAAAPPVEAGEVGLTVSVNVNFELE